MIKDTSSLVSGLRVLLATYSAKIITIFFKDRITPDPPAHAQALFSLQPLIYMLPSCSYYCKQFL